MAIALIDLGRTCASRPHADQEPGFSLVVIAVLTLGIAGNAAVFSLFKGSLKPIPRRPGLGDAGGDAQPHAPPADGIGGARLSLHPRQHDRPSSPAASMHDLRQRRELGADAERVSAEMVTGIISRPSASTRSSVASICRLTMSRPVNIRSRSSATGCGGAGSAPIQRIVGKTVHLNGQPLTIVGVAEPSSMAPSSAW